MGRNGLRKKKIA
ncbi:hypothetical protein RDI58_010584 [Solanum bulbocastanum]|uniref:Uncharacterized protein n=1 Tax=Solanum bulbocastanum TaxID=147425 RepID=A0AAN8YJM1_SOLBU